MKPKTWREELRKRGLETAEAVAARLVIDAEPDRVWETISSPGHLKHVHPFCAQTEVESWPGVGSRDFITYFSGIRYQRDVVSWLDGEGYDLEVGSPDKKTCRVAWRIQAKATDGSELSVSVYPYLESGWTKSQRSTYLDRFFGPIFDHYLDCVVKGVEYYVRTGNAVSEDQFGHNPVFSASH